MKTEKNLIMRGGGNRPCETQQPDFDLSKEKVLNPTAMLRDKEEI